MNETDEKRTQLSRQCLMNNTTMHYVTVIASLVAMKYPNLNPRI